MAQKVLKVGLRRKPGLFYFLDTDGDISAFRRGERAKKVERTGIRKENGYLYFVDKRGDISRARLARRR